MTDLQTLPEKLTEEFVKQYRDNYWLGLGDTSKLILPKPFCNRTLEQVEHPHEFILDLMRRPEYFGFTCKTLFGITLAPFQMAVLRELWNRPFPMLLGSRGLGKSFLLALYIMLRSLFAQGSKIVIVGSAFRQAKVVFDYCQDLWEKSPVLRSLVGDDNKATDTGKGRNGPRRDIDRCTLRMGESLAIALPLGDGSKIRGQRANIIISDEFASINKETFETVIRGFAAVSLSPVEKFQDEMRRVAMKDLGLWSAAHEALASEGLNSNQTVISGTAYYSWNHFYDYWKRYKAIIESRGDQKKLEEIFNGEVPERFDWKDYSIIRIPVDMLPPGFMDHKNIAQAKATIHVGTFNLEYGATFCADSNGFFKRSLIESCVVGRQDPIEHPSCGEVRFRATLRGNPKGRYVIAADPASEVDNFSIVVLDCWPEHRRIVNCWTTTKSRYKAKAQKGLTDENDFYAYAARKIRDLMHSFPTVRIAIDAMGGGVGVIEALQAQDRLKPGEQPIYPVIDPENPQDTDHLPGLHILEVIQFANAEWVSNANHGMRKDFEDKALLFPEFDPAEIEMALEDDKAAGRTKVYTDGQLDRLYDSLDDCMSEIEELKDELATIVHTQTGATMRDHWSTPETKIPGGKKGRLRKDRYSALLMANMVGRVLQRVVEAPAYVSCGGFAHEIGSQRVAGPLYVGPAWYQDAMAHTKNYGAVVRK
jgi:hypothetical protein